MISQTNQIRDRDGGLALSFLFLVIWFFYRQPWLVYAGMATLLLTMIWPPFMRPFAWLWFGFGSVMGAVVSKILLAIVWLVMVVPVGLARRALGKDSLALKAWREKEKSCFATRDHLYTAEDLKHPY